MVDGPQGPRTANRFCLSLVVVLPGACQGVFGTAPWRRGSVDLRDGALLVISPFDAHMLEKLIAWANENDPEAEKFDIEPFRQMLERDRQLSDKQRAWVKDVFERFCDEPIYKNLVSSGQVPRGREVELPAVLRPENLPKKPPQRRADG